MKNSFAGRTLHFFWNSSTLMTWASFLSRSINLVLILPLLVTRFSTAEIAIYYLFTTILGFIYVADFGFSSSFSRSIALAIGGAQNLRKATGENKAVNSYSDINFTLLSKLKGTISFIYNQIAIIAFFSMSIFGSLSVQSSINKMDVPYHGWIAWIYIIFSTTLLFRNYKYATILQGANEVALLRRWEAIFGILSGLSSVVILLLNGNLLILIVSNQTWLLIIVAWNSNLSKDVFEGFFKSMPSFLDKRTLIEIWPQAWKTGIGYLMSIGVIQLSGIIYAQLATPNQIATLLISLRLIEMVSQFSQAPFYSKLPRFATLFAQSRIDDLINLIKSSMVKSYLSFIFAWIFLGVFGNTFLQFIEANVEFPDPIFWALLGLGYLLMRFGAMHINIYSLTNDIKNHFVNGITGVIFIILLVILFPWFDIYALPFAVCISSVAFYSWYSAILSYKVIPMKFLEFEKYTSIPSFIIAMVYVLITIMLN